MWVTSIQSWLKKKKRLYNPSLQEQLYLTSYNVFIIANLLNILICHQNIVANLLNILATKTYSWILTYTTTRLKIKILSHLFFLRKAEITKVKLELFIILKPFLKKKKKKKLFIILWQTLFLLGGLGGRSGMTFSVWVDRVLMVLFKPNKYFNAKANSILAFAHPQNI